MKKILLFIIFIFYFNLSNSQTYRELFDKAETRLELSCEDVKPGVYELKVCYETGCDAKKIIIIN